jgi:type I restriction enzyme R subunit
MEGNEEIVNRVMSDKQFRAFAESYLAREVYERITGRITGSSEIDAGEETLA